MKGLPRYRWNHSIFYLIGLRVMVVNVISIQAQENATDLLNEKEKELKAFVLAVEANSRNCSAVIGCSSTSDGCSRLSCYEYGTRDDPNYKCLGVFNNSELCGSACKERNFDYSKGFVRLVDKDRTRTARTVCTHRNLDDYFKNSSMNNSSRFFRVFFGAVDGTTRIYPGADENCESDYDPRVRPWYILSTHVPKVVTLLVDSGLSMRYPTTHSSETYLGKETKTALKFLDTLREDVDYVNIMCFDGDGNSLKSPNATFLIYNITQYYEHFNEIVDGIVSNGGLNVVTSPNVLNTSNAINTAISQLNSSSLPQNYLKVAIVLTSGFQFQNLSELNIPANSGVNVFVYSFRTPDRTPECDPAIRAFSEGIPDERIDNPLYALESYYSFLAKIHKTFYRDPIDYGPRYPDHSGVDNNTLTLSKAAFGPSGELVGVMGIDIFENKVGEQFDPSIAFQAIVDAATHKDPQKTNDFNTSKDLTTPVCFKRFNFEDHCPSNVPDFQCKRSTGDVKVGCCGNCTTGMAPTMAPTTTSESKGTEWGKILGGVAAGVVGLLVIGAIVYFVRRCMNRRMEDEKVLAESPQFTFPGPENGTILKGDTRENFGEKAPG